MWSSLYENKVFKKEVSMEKCIMNTIIQFMKNYIQVHVCIDMNKKDIWMNDHQIGTDGYQYKKVLGDFYFPPHNSMHIQFTYHKLHII